MKYQLNSACQDIVLPQAIGFTGQDEIHQASEPEFWGLVFSGDPHYSCLKSGYTFAEPDLKSQVWIRMNFIVETIKKVINNPENYQLERIGNKKFVPTAEDLVLEKNDKTDTETVLFLGMPEDHDGRRFWKIQICNCERSNYVKQKPKSDYNLKFSFLETVCTGEDCHQFRISWKQGLENEQAKPLCKELWLAFQVAARLEAYRVSIFGSFESGFEHGFERGFEDNFKHRDEDVNLEKKHVRQFQDNLFKTCFEPEWLEIQKSRRNDSSEVFSGSS
eukprot:GHVP01032936.1.p1 GENE.GHVP01032936.1~~GHVP01032936.1.p1  ORF type:complete len:276 (-),score=36.54 GHVP01032936.1:97-924(-)